jgi:hypothetical protein
MKKILLLLLSVISYGLITAQPYENSWIRYNQEYYKIKVPSDGLYRVSQQALLMGGMSVTDPNFDPRKLQLFHNGIEEYIFIQGENDGHFDAGDFLEFYGQKNDGTLDRQLYSDTSWQPVQSVSLFNDTSVYFLTYNPLANGRRVTEVNDTTFGSYSASPYFIKNTYLEAKDIPNPHSNNIYGYNRGYNSNSIEYTESEGWGSVFGNYFGSNFPLPVNVSTDKVYAGGPNVEIYTTIGGVNNPQHNLTITFPGNNFTDVYYGQNLKKYNFSISPALLNTPATNFLFNTSTPVSVSADYSMLYYLSVKYPHTYDLEGLNTFKMLVPDDSQGKTKMAISNFNGGPTVPILYDITNHLRITVYQSAGTYLALVPNDNGLTQKQCYISAESVIRSASVSKINYVQNNPGYFNNISTIGTDSAFIIITNKKLWNNAALYKNYRNTTTNGHALQFDVNELYDQFAYGIEKHPLGIKNFSHFILDNWSQTAPPQHLFLIGKSISPADFRYNSSLYDTCLVASYGVPTSDILLTSGINGSIWEPAIPVGRISAKFTGEVDDYLHKVMEYDSAQNGQPQAWMKEILHFAGGDSPSQQAQLRGYLDHYKFIMEDSAFGGHVTTYEKNSSSPITINLSSSLQNQIDSGVSIMTFFGHASGSGFDLSTDIPANYGNHGRYPVIIANSCFAGDFHTSSRSVSEDFTMTAEKAAIAFLASVGQGIPLYLNDYSTAFFENASHLSYGSSIGTLMKKTIQMIQVTGTDGHRTVSQEMSLQGDPSLKLNSFLLPDYVAKEAAIKIIPSRVSTDIDTFTVNFVTRNWGKAVPDSFIVKITRTFPDGNDSVYTEKRGRCYYSDTLNFRMNTGGFNAAGINRIKVEVDLPDSVNEYENLFNNTASTDLFIISNDIVPVYPPKYAIHPYNTVTLKASTANPLAGMRTYLFQIDTIDLDLKDITPGMQNSPLFRFTSVIDSGGVLTWAPPGYTLLDSTVYFWRVANDSIQYDTVNFSWQQSSFMYISGKTGWAQSHFHQFKSDNYESVRYDTTNRVFEFVHNNKALTVRTYGAPLSSEFAEIGYDFNNSPIEYDGCQLTPAVMVAVLDSISLEPWNTCGNSFGQANTFTPTNGPCGPGVIGSGSCRQRPENYFIFRYSDPSQMSGLTNLINSVPNGNYILMYSWFTSNYSSDDPAFYNSLVSLGFNTGNLPDNTPYIYFIKKGDISTADQVHGTASNSHIAFNSLLSSVWNRGNVTSEIIGPVSRWESLHWNQVPMESAPSPDLVHVNIFGLNSVTRAWDTLVSGIQYATGKDTSLTWIPAATYPILKLQSYVQDDTYLTPAQMKYWRIYYDEVPECALNANNHFSFYRDPLEAGDTLKMSIAIDNIGNLPMDSLGFKFFMYDVNHTRHDLKFTLLDSLRIGQTLIAGINIDTTFSIPGENSLWVEANPFDTLHQLEKYHFNNVAEIKFTINKDNINPILDVTFDGIHILNNDIVSGKPQITIQLHDENRFLALNEQNKFKVYITAPNSTTPQLLDWNTPAYGQLLQFTPAVLPKNSCRIDWNPVFATDGIYTLEVEATDRSGNESGRYNYRISFEVINRSTITQVLNYPNPFSTSTRFVFTLTGNENPTDMKIQIITVTGKIIREIMLNELGNIHIGRNITDYAWDGKDEYGDQLGNGLYLYRVLSNINGESIEHRPTDADQYFKKGWGKMYLMR